MDNRSLATFLNVCRSGGIGKTAAQMNLTQSAVSRRIQSLEQELGVELFAPKGRGIEPTEVALTLMPHVETALGSLERIKTITSDARDRPKALRVAATPQTIASVLAPAMPQILEQNLSVQFVESGGADIARLVVQDACDCGISAHSALENGLLSQPIGRLHLRAIGPAVTRFAKGARSLDLAALFDEDLLLFDTGFQSRKVLEAAFQMNNRQINLAYEGKSSLAILGLAEAEVGIAVLPSNVPSHMPSRQIVFQERPLTIETTLIWRQGSLHSEAIRTLSAVLSKG